MVVTATTSFLVVKVVTGSGEAQVRMKFTLVLERKTLFTVEKAVMLSGLTMVEMLFGLGNAHLNLSLMSKR